MADIIPPIGAKGLFTLKEPFQELLGKNTPYQVQSIRRIPDLIAKGEDPFKVYYEPYKVVQEVFVRDRKNNTAIIGLQASTKWVYVPSSFILSYPGMNGVPYCVLGLGVSLTAIPQSTDLSGIKSEISSLIKGRLGVSCEIREMILSPITFLSKLDHDKAVAARSSSSSSASSQWTSREEMAKTITSQKEQIKRLEEYIQRQQKK